MKRRCRNWLAAGLSLAFATGAAGGTRFHEYTAMYKNPPHPAHPVSAGYLGGEGDEYLCGGAFLPDGSVLLAGNALGPEFTLDGPRVTIIGTDAPPLASPVKEAKDDRGQIRLTTPDWRYTQGAGFIVQLAPDLRAIDKALRLPWGSGALTDILADGQGNVFVTGVCSEGFSRLTHTRDVDTGIAGTDAMFFGKLARGLTKVEWCLKLMGDTSNAPKLALLADGGIALTASSHQDDNPHPSPLSSQAKRGIEAATGLKFQHFHRSGCSVSRLGQS